jgi:hypothetical protein
MKVGVGIHSRKLSKNRHVLENRRSDFRSLITGVNEFLTVISVFLYWFW